MKPLSIKQTNSDTITFTWDDGLVTPLLIHQLRDECPCAGCKGETILMHQILPVVHPKLPGHYDLKSIIPVGSYAIQISWGDGHATGLYSWEYLRNLHFQK
jgi:DUF971 family protein